MIFYNCLENFLLFIVLLNASIYPSASAGLYFAYCLGMTALSLSNEERRVLLKFGVSILMTVVTFGILLAKGYLLIKLNNTGQDLDLSRDDRLLYDSLGIRIDLTQKRITVWTTLMSVGFDSLQMILSILLTLVYNSHRKECKKKRGDDLNC